MPAGAGARILRPGTRPLPAALLAPVTYRDLALLPEHLAGEILDGELDWAWLVDPLADTVEVFERRGAHDLALLALESPDEVAVPPFDAVALDFRKVFTVPPPADQDEQHTQDTTKAASHQG